MDRRSALVSVPLRRVSDTISCLWRNPNQPKAEVIILSPCTTPSDSVKSCQFYFLNGSQMCSFLSHFRPRCLDSDLTVPQLEHCTSLLVPQLLSRTFTRVSVQHVGRTPDGSPSGRMGPVSHLSACSPLLPRGSALARPAQGPVHQRMLRRDLVEGSSSLGAELSWTFTVRRLLRHSSSSPQGSLE